MKKPKTRNMPGPGPHTIRGHRTGPDAGICELCSRKRSRSYQIRDGALKEHSVCYRCVRDSKIPEFTQKEADDHRVLLRSRYQKNKILTS